MHYEADGLKALAQVYRQMAAADRVSFVADAWAAVLAGYSAPAAYLDLTTKLSDETELTVWESVIESLRFIDDQQAGSSGRESFRTYARELLSPAFKRVGWEPRSDEEADGGTLRSQRLTQMHWSQPWT